MTIPVTLVVAAGTSASLAYSSKGTATLVDGLTQIALANQGLQLSFAQGYDGWKANKPTSRTVRGGMSGRVGGKKLNNIRVDIESHSGNGGKIQVQSGSGKRGYDLNLFIEASDIKSKQDIINWINRQSALKNLKPGELQEIADAMWRGY